MARKNANSKNSTTKPSRLERALFVGYVNVTLTDEDRTDFEGWVDDGEFPTECYLDALELGYQFTTKFDAENDAFAVSISSWDRLMIDAGIIYTGRSDDPERAKLKCLYVWDRKLERNLANGYVKRGSPDAF